MRAHLKPEQHMQDLRSECTVCWRVQEEARGGVRRGEMGEGKGRRITGAPVISRWGDGWLESSPTQVEPTTTLPTSFSPPVPMVREAQGPPSL